MFRELLLMFDVHDTNLMLNSLFILMNNRFIFQYF